MLNLKPNVLARSKDGSTAASGNYAVELRGVDIFYGQFRAVRDVNLKLEAGKITAMIGPSGCGKSTVLPTHSPIGDEGVIG